MSLSLTIITKDAARYIERLLQAGRSFADEIVVAVDSSSTDATAQICARYADKIFRVEPIGYVERALAWMNEQCSGDWILRLDDDELLSTRLVAALPRMMQDREITHYRLRRRWLVGRDEARWIVEHPWLVDWQLRLFRNIPSIVQVLGQLHTTYTVKGDGRFWLEGSLYHLDLVYHSETERLQKVQRYERFSPGRSQEQLYLIPDPSALKTVAVPADDPPYAGAPPLATEPAVVPQVRDVGLADLLRSAMQEYEASPELFRGSLCCTDLPSEMTLGEYHPAVIALCNDSPVAWAPPERGVPRVRIAYHWLRPNGEIYEHEGFRTDLPHVLRAGESTTVAATVLAPAEPGRFVLRWDLVIEGIAWFSTHGWRGPEAEVRIVDRPDPTFTAPAQAWELTALRPLLDRVRPYTMVYESRLIQLWRQVHVVLAEGIPGHFVECGTWRGGAAFLMADMLRQGGLRDRRVWLFDSFEGLPPPEEIDGPRALEYSRDPSPAWDNCRASLDEVQQTAGELGLLDHTVFVKGWFDQTLPANRDRLGRIAILRIDADWHAGVRRCLEELYDSVADGGFVIIDDYFDWEGCRVAVHEFLGERRLPHRLITSAAIAFFRKS